jgi:hypothetical protein
MGRAHLFICEEWSVDFGVERKDYSVYDTIKIDDEYDHWQVYVILRVATHDVDL